MMKIFVLAAVATTAVAAKRPVYNWADKYMESFKDLCKGNLKTMSHLFTTDGRLCFNNECGGPTLLDAKYYRQMYVEYEMSNVHVDEGYVSFQFKGTINKDVCHADVEGRIMAYLDDNGLIKEIHEVI